jgi:VanZ family protein
MVTVCALAFDPNPPPQIDTGWDKLNHLLAFGTLAPCTMLALQGRRRRRLGSGLFLLAFGAFIEVVQTQIPGRSGEWGDLLADSLGIVLGLLAARFIDRLLGTG